MIVTPSEQQIAELMLHWEQQWQAGEELSSELLCERHPELQEAVGREIQALKAMAWLSDVDSSPDGGSAEPDFQLSQVAALPETSLSTDAFCTALEQSGLISRERITSACQSVSQNSAESDARMLAEELVRTGSLTPFQATAILGGDCRPLVIDRYVILDTLGAGGMGVVYKARHRAMDRIVALKLLPPAAVDSREKVRRFQREARAAARLSHPNIVSVFDAEEAEGTHFLAMEYVSGIDLSQYVKVHGPLSVGSAVRCIRQAALGLGHAHQQGIVHRDVKPGNIMLCNPPDGNSRGDLWHVKILDMGLALIETSAATEMTVDRMTADSALLGTISFVAPEQALDAQETDARSDVYSLGATLFYLLTGRPPYCESTPMKTLLAHREAPVPSLRKVCVNIPTELDDLCGRMLAKDRAERFQSMEEVVAALDQLPPDQDEATAPTSSVIDLSSDTHAVAAADQATVPMPRPQVRPNPKRSRRGHLWITALLAAALLAGVVFRLRTSEGTLVIEVDDPQNVVVEVDGKQARVAFRPDGRSVEVSVDPGERKLLVRTAEGTVLKTSAGHVIEVSAGQKRTIRAWLEPPQKPLAEQRPPRPQDDAADRPEPVPPAASVENASFLDRTVAEWAIRIGGLPRVNGDSTSDRVRNLDDLPDGEIRLTGLQLIPAVVSLDEMKRLRGLKHLTLLECAIDEAATVAELARLGSVSSMHLALRPKVRDLDLRPLTSMQNLNRIVIEGHHLVGTFLEHFKTMKGLSQFGIQHTGTTDANLVHLSQMTWLTSVDVGGRQMTDAGLQHLKPLESLSSIGLFGAARVTGSGFSELLQLPIQSVSCLGCAISSDGAQQILRMPGLRAFHAEGNAIGDEAFRNRPASTALRALYLSGNPVTDEALATIAGISSLAVLDLENTQVTAAGVQELQQALPNCRIDSDFEK